MSQLFDPDEYQSDQDGGRPRRRRSAPKAKPVVRSDGEWYMIATTKGKPSMHRLGETPEQVAHYGSVVTKCLAHGRVVYQPPEDTVIVPCQECIRAEAQEA